MPAADQTLRDGHRLAWHQALAYALLGRVQPRLGTQTEPDLATLVRELDGLFPSGRSDLNREIARVRNACDRGGWPVRVPDELASGLGPAQFAAALTELRRLLGLDAVERRAASNRSLDAAEQALLRDLPPHHGR